MLLSSLLLSSSLLSSSLLSSLPLLSPLFLFSPAATRPASLVGDDDGGDDDDDDAGSGTLTTSVPFTFAAALFSRTSISSPESPFVFKNSFFSDSGACKSFSLDRNSVDIAWRASRVSVRGGVEPAGENNSVFFTSTIFCFGFFRLLLFYFILFSLFFSSFFWGSLFCRGAFVQVLLKCLG